MASLGNTIINGINTTVSTSESLPSSSKIDYVINFYDRNGNILKTTNNTGSNSTTENVVGKQGTESFSKLLNEYRDTFINIDMQVINEFSDLFFGLW